MMTKKPTGADGTHLPNPDDAYQQGRTARLNGISKEEAPYGEDDDKAKEWLNGWRYEDRIQDRQGNDN